MENDSWASALGLCSGRSEQVCYFPFHTRLAAAQKKKKKTRVRHSSMPDPPPTIQVLPLGAGQEVGRSCVIVGIGGRTLMFDCGMHMGYSDSRRCVFVAVVVGQKEGAGGRALCRRLRKTEAQD